MGGIFGVLRPVIEIRNMINYRIKFRNEIDAKERFLGTYRFPVFEANKTVEVDKLKVKSCCHKLKGRDWKIHILVNGKSTGLYLEPRHLLNYAQIIFEYKAVEGKADITVLCAKGLKEESSQWIAQLSGCGLLRKRKYSKTQRKFGLQDIGEVQLPEINEIRKDNADLEKKAGSQAGVCDSPLNVSKLRDHVGSSEEVAISNAEPTHKEKVDCTPLEYHQPSTVDGMTVAAIPTSDVEPEIQRWKYAIVAYLVGEDTQDYKVERYVKEQWTYCGSFQTYSLKPGFFLFNFTNSDDRFKVLEQSQQFINNMPFILKRWTPHLSSNSSEFLATMPVWVRFPCLKLEYWSPESLSKICSLIGNPLFSDNATLMKEMLEYARVCIEIKLGGKLPNIVRILVDNNETILEQAVEYEWKPEPCGYCFSLLHDSFECFLTTNNVGDTLETNSVEDNDWKPQPCGSCFSFTSDDDDASSDNDTSADDENYENNLWKDEVPGLTTDSDDGHDADNIVTKESCDPNMESLDCIASAFAMIDNDEFENEVYYTPTACLVKIEKNSSMKWPFYYTKLKDIMGLK